MELNRVKSILNNDEKFDIFIIADLYGFKELILQAILLK